jgi:hypothetical protein
VREEGGGGAGDARQEDGSERCVEDGAEGRHGVSLACSGEAAKPTVTSACGIVGLWDWRLRAPGLFWCVYQKDRLQTL